MIAPMRFANVMQTYSHLLFSGHTDTDLNARQRKVTGVLLNIVSNTTYGDYPPTPEQRELALKKLGDFAWETRAITQALGKSADDTFAIALERASQILRNI